MPVYRDESHRFINPYTFIPPRHEGPLFSRAGGDVSHALFDDHLFTGRIECELEFVTPAVIPGKRKEPEKNPKTPGEIYAYTISDNGVERLAIPGSRMRGHLLHLMKMINGSAITADDFGDRVIIERKQNPICGFVWRDTKLKQSYVYESLGFQLRKNDNTTYRVREILVASNDRPTDPHRPWSLQGTAQLQQVDKDSDPRILDDKGNELGVPSYELGVPLNQQGLRGTAYWGHPNWGSVGTRIYKSYLAAPGDPKAVAQCGRWVKFSARSGQDGENDFRDIGEDGKAKTHLNSWHIIDLDNMGDKFDLTCDIVDQFRASVESMELSAKDNQDDSPALKIICENILKQLEYIDENGLLKEGTFVYFSPGLTSVGLHYRYLFRVGSIRESVEALKQGADNNTCAVSELAGRAGGKGTGGWRSRLWVDMAIGPKKCANGVLALRPGQPGDLDEATCQQIPLRILSSPPPKAARFYLRQPFWNQNGSAVPVRGRKVYWHDPKWNSPAWENPRAPYSFQNPAECFTDQKNQWSYAEVVPKGSKYCFTVRLLNADENEVNLLLAALVGLSPEIVSSKVGSEEFLASPGDDSETWTWCHKIGYARPFMGSAVIRVKAVKKLEFEDSTSVPVLREVPLCNVVNQYKEWRERKNLHQTNALPHLARLKRVMSYYGAFEIAADKDAKIGYPLGKRTNDAIPQPLAWPQDDWKNWPTIYDWFSNAKDPAIDLCLPDPDPHVSQSLPGLVSYRAPRNPGGGGGPQHRGRPRNQGGNRR